MADESETFKSNIKTVLADEHTRKVSFNAKGLQIRPEHFGIISKLLTDGKMKAVIDPNIKKGRAAEYSADKNTIYGKEAGIEYNDQKATIVHECAHADLDCRGGEEQGFSVTNLINEMMGFLVAQSYQHSINPRQMLMGTSDPNTVAFNVIKAKCGSTAFKDMTMPIDYSDAEVKPLLDCIEAHEEYRASAKLKSKTDGIK